MSANPARTKDGFQLSTLCASVLILILTIPVLTKSAIADNINPGVFSIDSKPFGEPYSQWVAKWWQWAFSIPKEKNPLNDPTGQICAVNQNDPNVWFLDEVPSGSATLYCNVPKDRAVFTTILAGECDYRDDPTYKTESELSKCALSGIQGGTMQVSVDGIPLKNLQGYYVESPLFDLTLAADNTLGITAIGTTQAKAVGYYLFLQPLAPGKHIIHESYSIIDNPTLGTYSAAVDETYDIEVKP